MAILNMRTIVASSLLLLLFLLSERSHAQQLAVVYETKEEQDAGTLIGEVAKDSFLDIQFSQSQLQNFQYRIPSTTVQFQIDRHTSTLTTGRKLDREFECQDLLDSEPCVIQFDVSVYRVDSDGGFNLIRIIKVGVTILDINDNAPAFPSNRTTLDVPESMEVGQVLRTSGAADKDTGQGYTVQSYSLEGGEDLFELQVIEIAGSLNYDIGIVLKGHLDSEEKKHYELKVIAFDGGTPRLSGSVEILINVFDVNDNRPTFTKTAFNTTVAESADVGATILTLDAFDLDENENGRMAFSFSSFVSSKVKEYMAINESSGEIYLVKRLDYETDKLFRFSVTVNDHGSPAKSSQASVLISVDDVNDNAPRIDITLPSASVKESLAVGSYVAHVSFSDRDSNQNSEITCSIANEHFTLQKFPDSDFIYTITLKSSLDYEIAKFEVLNVTCVDRGKPPLSNSSAFTLQIQDVNDNAPAFTLNNYKVTIEEGNDVDAFVTQIEARDPDEGEGGNISFSLKRQGLDKFRIDAVTGVIRASQSLDREDIAVHELQVIAQDGGSPPMSSSTTVTVLVSDINDNPPKFIRPRFEMRLRENQPNHTVVGSVFATDPDTGVDNALRFTFFSNFSFPDIFGIDGKSGIIYTQVSLDREMKDLYTFDVAVFDRNKPDFRDVVQVDVSVADVNDNKPNITFPNAYNKSFNVLYTRPPGSVLCTVEAEDPDARENATVKFFISHGNAKDQFFINSITGDLVVARRLNTRDTGAYTLTILARDSGDHFLQSSREIDIVVMAANGTASPQSSSSLGANMAIVITLVGITAVLAVAVLVTICIIRKVDRERKQNKRRKATEEEEEENIYKQQLPSDAKSSSSRPVDAENEIEKLKRQIHRDLSFVVDDDQTHLNSSSFSNVSTSFSTFKNVTPETEQNTAPSAPPFSPTQHNTLSPRDGESKRSQYMDKALEFDRLTSTTPPPRSQPKGGPHGSGSSFGKGVRTASGRRAWSQPIEDANSSSSGSTNDSGRGGSSEELNGQGRVIILNVGNDGGHTLPKASHAYPTSAQLVTFNSPKSPTSSSSSSHLPRSLSTTMTSDASKKRIWGDSTPNTSGCGTPSRDVSINGRQAEAGFERGNTFKPNISFSDDSLTANTMVEHQASRQYNADGNIAVINIDANKSNNAENSSRLQPTAFEQQHTGRNHSTNVAVRSSSSDCLSSSYPMRNQVLTSSSKDRPRLNSHPNNSDTPYRLLGANISRIPMEDSTATRHGTFVDYPSCIEPPNRSRSYATTTGAMRNSNDFSNRDRRPTAPVLGVDNNSGQLSHRLSYHGDPDITSSSMMGEPYSLADVNDVLHEDNSRISARYDDDNTTTTSGSYTINADELYQEIDHLFFKDIVV